MTGTKTALWIVAAAMLWAGQGLAAEKTWRLQALLATSGERVSNLLDENPRTGWKPVGDPNLEGVLLRFERSVPVSHVEVTPCPGSPSFWLTPFVNSLRGNVCKMNGPERIQLSRTASGALALRSLFLRFSEAGPGACIGEVVFQNGRTRLRVQPPREVEASVEVSSTLKPEAAYHKSYLFDQSSDFGWVEGARGLGEGERITVAFAQPQDIRAIQIKNGYQRSRDHFQKNARVARLKVATADGQAAELEVPDKMGQSLLPFRSRGKVHKLTLEIAKARAGTRYRDLVISEIRFRDAQGFYSVETGQETGLRKALTAKLAKKPLASIVDHEYESFCRVYNASAEMTQDTRFSDHGKRKLKMRSNHRLVHYSQVPVGDEARIVSESIEGIWVPENDGKPDGPWSVISLYGRSQKIGHDIKESYEVVTRNTRTRIIGGKLRIARVEDLGRKRFLALVRKWEKGPASYKVRCGARRDIYFTPGRQKTTTRDDQKFKEFYHTLVREKAIVVQGRAIADLFI